MVIVFFFVLFPFWRGYFAKPNAWDPLSGCDLLGPGRGSNETNTPKSHCHSLRARLSSCFNKGGVKTFYNLPRGSDDGLRGVQSHLHPLVCGGL